MARKKEVYSTALLKTKDIHHEINPESMPFEKYISSPDIAIKIDFPNGKSLLEKNFKSVAMPMNRFFIEFFEDYSVNDIMNYLTNEASDYRVTSLDGTIIRLSHKDYSEIDKINSKKNKNKKIKEFVFAEEKLSFFQKIKRKMQKKDK